MSASCRPGGNRTDPERQFAQRGARGSLHGSMQEEAKRPSTRPTLQEHTMTVLPGIYRALVVGHNDPQGRKRLLVTAPGLLGPEAVWAEACMPCRSRAVPAVGSSVWLQFEGGDPGLPVWVGTRP